MPLNDTDAQILREMQQLCLQVEDDIERGGQWLEWLAESEARRARLEQLYERDWLRLTESPALTEEQRLAFAAAVPDGRYSVLGEDTVWNALSEFHERRVQLIKALAAQL